jgi:hypothetical protein
MSHSCNIPFNYFPSPLFRPLEEKTKKLIYSQYNQDVKKLNTQVVSDLAKIDDPVLSYHRVGITGPNPNPEWCYVKQTCNNPFFFR